MKWKVLSSENVFSSGFFRIQSDRCELPDGRVMPRYYVMSFPDWVNILPITKDGQVLLVRQYRHASGKVHLEIPGGSLDPQAQESTQEGARREMLEETGYDSTNIVKVLSHYPNPALQSNQMHTYIAFNCAKTQEPQLDPFEDLELYQCSLDRLEEHLLSGDIDHSLMIAAVTQALAYLKKNKSF